MNKILIVDDEVPFLLSLKDGLAANSDQYQIVTAENGREAVEVLRSTAIDLLVTDLKLPEMNGFELLAWTSRHQPQLPVIVMSAFGTPEIEARLAKMDTLQFLDKPLDLRMLQEGIANGLNAGGKSFIRGITLATFLQLMKVEKKNCTLKILNTDHSANLYVRNGELIDADLDGRTGIDAAMEIVSWSDSEIEMDGICRRQEDVINLSLEHLLIEAFRRKDEAEEQERAGAEVAEPPTSTPQQPTQAKPKDTVFTPLAKILTKLAAVQEFAIFDTSNKLVSKNAGRCSIEGMDLASFDLMLNALADDLQSGNCRFITFNSIGKNRFILLYFKQYSVLAKLKPGARAQQVGAEIEQHLDI